jgi:DNA-binding transcriptional LysR family regulator
MEVRALECFVAVARHRHFTRAADELYLTQSAVSQQVRRLEAELAVVLFERGASVALTPAGQELLPRAVAILGSLADARAAVAGAAVGTVRVAAEYPAGLAAAVAAFHVAHPAVRVSFEGGDVYVGADPLPGWTTTPLAPEPLVVLGAHGVVELQSLKGRTIVLPERSSVLRRVVDAAFESVGFGAVPVVEASDVALVRELVAAGAGVTLLPATWAGGGARLAEEVLYEPVVAVRPGAPPAAAHLAAAITN